MVLLHGWGGDFNTLNVFACAFEGKFKIVSFSLHSIEKNIAKPLNLNSYAQTVLQVLTQEKIESAIFVGHSFGARVIAKINCLNAGIMEKIIFLNPAGIKPKFSFKKWLKIRVFKICKKLNIKTKLHGSEDYKHLSPIMKKTFVNVISERLEKLFKQIAVPTLIISGDCDMSTPPYMVKKMTKLVKHSKLELLKNCGHFCFLEQTNQTILLAQFFVF